MPKNIKSKFMGTSKYDHIRYFTDAQNRLWSGPHAQEDTLHYKIVLEETLYCSAVPHDCAEITPYQAACWLEEHNRREK